MEKLNYTNNSIRTYTGKVFDLAILDPDSIDIEDIAHGLAYAPRFAGQLERFYSVAQHSYFAYLNAAPENKLAALLHDASEAYIGDMPSPFKKMMPDYRMIEENLMKAIVNKFGLSWPLPEEVKEVDKYMFQVEWNGLVMGLLPIHSWTPQVAKSMFLEAFYSCKSGKSNP